jgi:hypothetical protein
MNKFKNFKPKAVLNGIKHYAVDTTGLLLASTPIYAAMETFVAGMDSVVSMESRLKAAGLGFLGMGVAYAKGRDFSNKIFKMEEKSEKKKILHDSLYNAGFNIAFAFPVYLSSGASLNEALVGTGGAVALGLVSGPINGYSIDTMRDFFGTKKSKRLPRNIQGFSQKIKYGLVAASIVGAVGLTKGVYELNDFLQEKKLNKKEIVMDNLEFFVEDQNTFDATNYFSKNLELIYS